jgi:hypothetical protein
MHIDNGFVVSRDGEWGDHVTLQAAADYVTNHLFLLSILTVFSVHLI